MWNILTTDTFDQWFDAQNDHDRARVLASLIVLRERGPKLKRPYADSIKGSRFQNMKELRVQSKGDPIRVFFAFDPKRQGVLLCAGHKTKHEKRFYEVMIHIADKAFTAHLERLNQR